MIIGLSGYARSGKDTVAEMLCLNNGYQRKSFADPMRDALYRLNPIIIGNPRTEQIHLADYVDEFGWDEAKAHPEPRRLLQVFGTEVGRGMFGENFWVDQAFKQVTPTDKYVFADVRFPNEADRVRQLGGVVVRINRHNHSAVNSHISERALDNYMFDHFIYNDGTKEELSEEVLLLVKELLFKQ